MSKGYDFNRLLNAGILYADAVSLRRISMTLHRWHELECGDSNNYASWCILRGKRLGNTFEYDDDGKPYMEWHRHDSNRPSYVPIADRERGALKRLAKIMANYPKLTSFVQTDPRGCALYIGEGLTDENYSSKGIAIYK